VMRAARLPLRCLFAGPWNTAFGVLADPASAAVDRAMGWHYLVALFPAQILSVLNAYLTHCTFQRTDDRREACGVVPSEQRGAMYLTRLDLVPSVNP
jgi:hypothetical protein